MNTSNPQATTVTRDDERSAVAAAKRTAAQRQRAYRLRLKRAAIEAIGEENDASRVALLALLGSTLAALEARDTPASMHEASRNSVRRILNVIVTRYAIEL